MTTELKAIDAVAFIKAWVQQEAASSASDVAAQIKRSLFSRSEPAERPSPRRDAGLETAALQSLLHELQSALRQEQMHAIDEAATKAAPAASAGESSIALLPGEQHLLADLAEQKRMLEERQEQLIAAIALSDVEIVEQQKLLASARLVCSDLQQKLTTEEYSPSSTTTLGDGAEESCVGMYSSISLPSHAELDSLTVDLRKASEREAALRNEISEQAVRHSLDLRRARQNLRDWQTHLHALLVEEERLHASRETTGPSTGAAPVTSVPQGEESPLSQHSQNLQKILQKLQKREQMLVLERQQMRSELRLGGGKKAIAAVLRGLREPLAQQSPT
jgi:hypothetical protein